MVVVLLDFPHIEAEFTTQEEVHCGSFSRVLRTLPYIDLRHKLYSCRNSEEPL